MPSREEADKILQARRKRKACYPCASRKVKCNGVWPCSTCVQRGHPEICIADGGKERTSRRRRQSRDVLSQTRSIGEGSASSTLRHDANHPEHAQRRVSRLAEPDHANEGQSPLSSTPVLHVHQTPQDDGGNPSYVGANSTPSFVSGSPFAGGMELERDVRPALGLQNTLKSYPFMKRGSSQNLVKEIDQVIPSHADVLKYSQCYQTIVYPFHPFVSDKDDLESLICFYLELTSSRESSEVPAIGSEQPSVDVAQTSLLLAILASGVQFSDLPTNNRINLSREFTRRSFHCARLANFLLRPNINTLQALLILGHVLQNDGQADAAWAFLGTTTRLAQSLGLHLRSTDGSSTPEHVSNWKLWSAMLSQDCVLSLSFDRSPVSTSYSALSTPLISGSHDFASGMYGLTEVSRGYLLRPHSERAALDVASYHLGQLDQLRRQRDLQLQGPRSRISRQARMEHHALRIHFAFFESVVCRAFLKRTEGSRIEDSDHAAMALRAKLSFVETMRAFLDLQSLTVVPLRSWSMIHAGLSSALLLEVFGLPEEESVRSSKGPYLSAQDVQSRFVKVLSIERPASEPSVDSDNQPLLSASHSKALNALKNSISRRQAQSNTQEEQPYDVPPVGVVPSYSEPQRCAVHPSTSLNQPLMALPEEVPPLNYEPVQGMEEIGQLFDNFGNIDWGNGFFEDSTGFNSSLDQLQWGI